MKSHQLGLLTTALLPLFFGLLNLTGCQTLPTSESSKNLHISKNSHPLIIAHRGYPGLYPDHTLESYRAAIVAGADIIEPDLVSTKDGFLICRHENDLSQTTNVSDVFPQRKRTAFIDGEKYEGWFSEDFTLAEIKMLKARQPLSFRSQSLNDLYLIPTFEEFLDLILEESQKRERAFGIYPETKHPTYHKVKGLALEEKLLRALKDRGFHQSPHPVFIQSFEVTNLQQLRASSLFYEKYRLTQLIDDPEKIPFDQLQLPLKKRTFQKYKDILSPQGLKKLTEYAHGVGPWKKILRLHPEIIQAAHLNRLVVHPYTFRDEPHYLEPEDQGDPLKEYEIYFRMGVDGVFSDFTPSAIKARERFQSPHFQ